MIQKATIKTSMLRLVIDCGIIKVIPLLLVTQMKNNKRWIHSNKEFKRMPHVEQIPFAIVMLVMKEMMKTQQTMLYSSRIILKHMVLASLVAL